ncbi:YjbQ family protein [Labilibacter sediminis]|nr:YjbQ family protein [Labilibacter sediminis]
MIQQTQLRLPEFRRGFHLITSYIESHINLPEEGLLNLFLQHTSAGLTINENADPSVRVDFETIMNNMAPENLPEYTHTLEGSDDMPSHVKSSLIGQSLTIPITNGELNLGTWQGIYFCEFRNFGGHRNLIATVYS